MDKKQLMQYRALLNEQPELEREIRRLYQRLESVKAERKTIGYDVRTFEIEADRKITEKKPETAVEIRRQILIKEKRLENTEKERTKIEHFIANIPSSLDRQIFELSFLNGKTQREIGEAVGYSRGRVSQIISEYLKNQ